MRWVERGLERLRKVRPGSPERSPQRRPAWRAGVVTALLTLLAALLGFWGAFPEEQLLEIGRRTLFEQTGLVFRARTVETAFPFRLRFAECRLEPLPIPLVLEQVEVSPVWSRLLIARPTLAVQASGYAGELAAELSRGGALDLKLSGVEIARVEGLPGGYRLAGTLSASAHGALGAREQLDWQVRLDELSVSGLQPLGIDEALPLGEVELSGTLQGRNLKFESLRVGGGILEASGSGTLALGQTPATSRIAATLQLRPTERMPQALRELMSLTGQSPDPDGWYRLRLNGRLDAPSIR